VGDLLNSNGRSGVKWVKGEYVGSSKNNLHLHEPKETPDSSKPSMKQQEQKGSNKPLHTILILICTKLCLIDGGHLKGGEEVVSSVCVWGKRSDDSPRKATRITQ